MRKAALLLCRVSQVPVMHQFVFFPQCCVISCFILKVWFYVLLGVLIPFHCPDVFHLCPIFSLPPVSVSSASFDSSVFLCGIQPLLCFLSTSCACCLWTHLCHGKLLIGFRLFLLLDFGSPCWILDSLCTLKIVGQCCSLQGFTSSVLCDTWLEYYKLSFSKVKTLN